MCCFPRLPVVRVALCGRHGVSGTFLRVATSLCTNRCRMQQGIVAILLTKQPQYVIEGVEVEAAAKYATSCWDAGGCV